MRKDCRIARNLTDLFDGFLTGRCCPRCGGEVRVIAAITEPALIARILEHRTGADYPGGGARAPPSASLH